MAAYSRMLDPVKGALGASVLRDDGAVLCLGCADWNAYSAWVAAGNTPSDPPLADYRAVQIRRLYAACDTIIAGGFTSSALGVARVYPMKLTDQQNRDSAYLDLLDALLTPTLSAMTGTTTWLLWCQDPASGAWSRAAHTAAQVRQARIDTRTALIAAQTKLAGLVAQVNAATTPATVQAVTWA